MIERLLVSTVVLALGTAVALAQTGAAMQSTEDCIRHASELADDAEARDLTDEKLDRIEELLTRMETHCEAKQYDEALAVAKDIQKAIEGE